MIVEEQIVQEFSIGYAHLLLGGACCLVLVIAVIAIAVIATTKRKP